MRGREPPDIPPPPVVEVIEDASGAIAGYGQRDRRRLPQRLPRGILGALLVAAVAGMVGFALGSRGSHQSPPVRTIFLSPVSVAPTVTNSPAYSLPTAGTCSLQLGHRLQLGVELQDSGSAEMILRSVTPRFPLAGLRAVHTEVGPCGQQQRAQIANNPIRPGGSLWITTTVDVLVSCPTALPVQFEVVYTSNGRTFRLPMGGFADLGGVPYTGCG